MTDPQPPVPPADDSAPPPAPGFTPPAAPGYTPPAAPAAPAYTAPPASPGQPAYPAYGQPVQGYYAPPTNTMAIVAMSLSLAALILGITAIVGAILGHVALGQIKRTGEGGRGFALTGIIVGWAITGLYALLIIIFIIIGIAAASNPYYYY